MPDTPLHTLLGAFASLGTVAPFAIALAVILALLALVVRRGRGSDDHLAAVSRSGVAWQRKRLLNNSETVIFESACAVAAGIHYIEVPADLNRNRHRLDMLLRDEMQAIAQRS